MLADTVFVQDFYPSCLAHANYLVGPDGLKAVIGPRRDIDNYLRAVKEKGSESSTLETHLPTDFISRHRELAERTGATIYLEAGSGTTFPHVAFKDGDSIRFGESIFDFRQPPRHAAESISIVMT